MLIKIAWRNIWRNPLRSLVLIIAIVIGVWALIFINGLSSGMVDGYISNAISNRTAHIQAHSIQFERDNQISHSYDGQLIRQYLKESDKVHSYAPRVIVNSMMSASQSTQGATIIGIDTLAENNVTPYKSKIIEGKSFDASIKNPILISQYLADKMKVKLHSKLIGNFQNKNGEIVAAKFRVIGLLNVPKGDGQELNILTPIDGLRSMTELDDHEINEMAILMADKKFINDFQNQLTRAFPSLSIKNYKEIAPDINLMGIQIYLGLSVMLVIFMMALIFGIINTMLMAVLERYKELGMLMAVGMNKTKLFLMIVLETIFISIVGLPIGIMLGSITIYIYQQKGLHLDRWAQGLEEFGMTSVLYPQLSLTIYGIIAVSVFITALVAALYPARKVININPIDAINKL